MWRAGIIFFITYLGLAFGRIPGWRIDRTGMALLGAVAMLLSGVLTLPAAYAAIDGNTIVLLFAMMIVAAYIRIAHGFRLVAFTVLKQISQPLTLLAATIFISGILSAIFVNDIICLVLTPIVLEVVERLELPPVPYLIAVATSSNIGSTASAVGNPQNILIASLGGLSFRAFIATLGPVALIGLILNYLIIFIIYRDQLRTRNRSEKSFTPIKLRAHRAVLGKSGLITILMLIAFFAGMPLPLAATGAAGLLLLTRRVKPEKIYAAIDWELLMLFAGLFVIVRGLEVSGMMARIFAALGPLPYQNITLLSGLTLILSNIVSNVPAVLLMRPIILQLPDATRGWYILAMASTLAGNLTILGSVANLIVVESARRHGVVVSFIEYLKVGVPITIITLLIGILFLR